MNSTHDKSWGFLHPKCHGHHAITFFSWDLARTIEQQFNLHADSPLSVRLVETQKAVDQLLEQYVQIQANPRAFEGQSITLFLERDDSNSAVAPILALQTTPRLEELILDMQARQQSTHTNH